jgi:hypothetical protein
MFKFVSKCSLIPKEKKTSTEALSEASRDVCVEVNVEKTKYMVKCRHHNAGKITI